MDHNKSSLESPLFVDIVNDWYKRKHFSVKKSGCKIVIKRSYLKIDLLHTALLSSSSKLPKQNEEEKNYWKNVGFFVQLFVSCNF